MFDRPTIEKVRAREWCEWRARVVGEIDHALAALVDVKPLAEYGEVGTYDTVQARRQRALAQAEQALLNLRRELSGTAGVQESRPLSGEPVAWQWRRAGESWSIDEHIFYSEPAVTAPGTEKRALYAGPVVAYGVQPSAEPLRHSTKENGDCPHWCKACAAEAAARGVQASSPVNWQDTPQGKKLLRACAKNVDKLAQELNAAGGCVFNITPGVPASLNDQSKGGR